LGGNRNYEYEIAPNENKFFFKLSRASTGEVLFYTLYHNFIYSNFMLEVGTNVTTDQLYGLGERRSQFKYKTGNYSMFNLDKFIANDTGYPGNQT